MADFKFAVIRCSRVRDLPNPYPRSTKQRCYGCGTRVWLADTMVPLVQRHWPGKDVKPLCLQCPVPEEGEERALAYLPEQVAMLRDLGASDENIAYTFAMAELSSGRRTLEDTAEEILRHPDGLLAKSLPAILDRMRLVVAMADSPRLN